MISPNTGASAPTFDHPLEILLACHGKIQRQCDTLRKLAANLREHGCDAQAQQAAQGILRYFDTAGQFHHQDEEENLFPALRASADVDAAQLESLLQRLLDEHVVLLAAWDELRTVLVQLAAGIDMPLDDKLTGRFIRGYTGHIAIENTELLPLAARLLTDTQIRQIGTCMAERRGTSLVR